jgi:hypothetical protein
MRGMRTDFQDRPLNPKMRRIFSEERDWLKWCRMIGCCTTRSLFEYGAETTGTRRCEGLYQPFA